MAKLPTLDQFAGDWTIERTIEDRMHGQNGQLEGGARIEPGGLEGGYIYREAGKLALEGGTEMEALRVYLWGPHEKGISVHFQDGRDFHVIELDRLMPDAQHHCAPDMYHVSYDFSRWPEWTSKWRVQGPKKDYKMVTRYTRKD
jgi:hypothetical protein